MRRRLSEPALLCPLVALLALGGCGEDTTAPTGGDPTPEPAVTELRYDMVEITGLMTPGDFDGDGHVDLVFTIRTLDGFPAGSNLDLFRVVYGDGKGAWSEPVDLERLGSSDTTTRGRNFVTARFDGDAIDDFAFANASVLEVFRGDAGRTPAPLYRTGFISRVFGSPLAAIDTDTDADLDLVLLDLDLLVLPNVGGTFENTETVETDLLGPTNFIVGEFSGGGEPDALVVGAISNFELGLALYTGDESGFNAPGAIDTLSTDLFLPNFAFEIGSKEMASGDFDGDGDLDVALTSTGNFVQVLENDGTGVFRAGQRVSVGIVPIHVLAAPVDGDAEIDLVVVNSASQSVMVCPGNGDGTFADDAAARVVWSFGGEFAFYDAALADLDDDGQLDLIVAEDGTNPLDSGRGSIQFLYSVGYGPPQPTSAPPARRGG